MISRFFFFTFFLFVAILSFAQPESYYIEKLGRQLDGVTEYRVNGGRVDIVNEQYAIEVERADNWKQSIGQCLRYGLQTNKKPGIILLMKNQTDRKYGIQLQTAIVYANLDIKVWFYPEDFGGALGRRNSVEQSFINDNTALQEQNGGCKYWINTSKKKTRHNQTCRWYNNTKRGRCTNKKEGNACGQCGG